MASWNEPLPDQWEDMVNTMLSDPYANSFGQYNDANSGFTRNDMEAAAKNSKNSSRNPACNSVSLDIAMYDPVNLGSFLHQGQYISDMNTMTTGAGEIPTIPYRRQEWSVENCGVPQPAPLPPTFNTTPVWNIDSEEFRHGGWLFDRSMNDNPGPKFSETSEQFWQQEQELLKGLDQNIGITDMFRVDSSGISNPAMIQNGYLYHAQQNSFDQFPTLSSSDFDSRTLQATMVDHGQIAIPTMNKKRTFGESNLSHTEGGQSLQALPERVPKRTKLASSNTKATSTPSQHIPLRELKPRDKVPCEYSMSSLSINDLARMPAVPKEMEIFKSWACTFCRLKGTGCKRDEGHSRCECCEVRYGKYIAIFGNNPPTLKGITSTEATNSETALKLKEITLLATGDLLMRIMELKKDETPRVGRNLEQNIFFYLEPFSSDYTAPRKVSNIKTPIMYQKYNVEMSDGKMQTTLRLSKSSMQSFIRQVTMRWLPDKLRSINHGIVPDALDIISCFSILSNREKNKIFLARHIAPAEAARNAQIFLFSVLLELEERLVELHKRIRSTGTDPQQARKNTCVAWIIFRFMNSKRQYFKKSRANASTILDANNLSGYGRAMYNFETHFYEQTDSLMSTLQDFTDDCGAYFCHAEKFDLLQHYVGLLNLQGNNDPLINITINKSRPIEIELLYADTEIFGPRAFTDVLESNCSMIADCFQALTLDPVNSQAVPTSIPTPLKKKHELDALQLHLTRHDPLSDSSRERKDLVFSLHNYDEGLDLEDLPSLTSRPTVTYNGLDTLLADLSISHDRSPAATPQRWQPDFCALWEDGIIFSEMHGAWCNAEGKRLNSYQVALRIQQGPSESYLREKRWETWDSADFEADIDGLLEEG